MYAAVEETVQARLILSPHRSVRLRTVLSYLPEDPFAVSMAFPAEFSLDEAEDERSAEDIVWVFARQLLSSGLELPAGLGDVHVRPTVGRRTMVELRAPEGTALLRFDTTDLRRFLWRSRLLVPEGEEHLHLDADRALAQLLG
ncbi:MULTISPECIES: SsgA family sporulation/cell division regulator [Kitasatospora]|uniref:SsgA family sporulation/cell division regulator n=1 Tax=Kitasatospora cathayae TaxID=3004092 RepID=A0ABY7Q7S2_9ACTN|nr:SsgA family sporulation/cell division regulator [Kitasatospora sp. HUAS 3-15]WBP88631.1 SsgA family sporulation/cell division regulator [Kitasatospora sp. HUAS 3-15]